eukprot:scpid62176/ scgid31679/ 
MEANIKKPHSEHSFIRFHAIGLIARLVLRIQIPRTTTTKQCFQRHPNTVYSNPRVIYSPSSSLGGGIFSASRVSGPTFWSSDDSSASESPPTPSGATSSRHIL